MGLLQTTLGQISIAPWTDRPSHREKRRKRKLNKQEQQKRHIAKRAGHPERRRRWEWKSLTEL
jgi:hypothetical protein